MEKSNNAEQIRSELNRQREITKQLESEIRADKAEFE